MGSGLGKTVQALQSRAAGTQGRDLICAQRLPKPKAGWLHRKIHFTAETGSASRNASSCIPRAPGRRGGGQRKGWDPCTKIKLPALPRGSQQGDKGTGSRVSRDEVVGLRWGRGR